MTKEIHDIRARKSYTRNWLTRTLHIPSQVWSPETIVNNQKLIENIEKVQRRATKYILNLMFITKYFQLARIRRFSSSTLQNNQ